MERSLLYRGILIAAVLIVCVLLIYPPKKKITLGLDLQGGSHLVLKVNTVDALKSETDNYLDTLRRELESRGIVSTVERTSDTSFDLIGVDAAKDDEIEDKIVDAFLPNLDMDRSAGRLKFKLTTAGEKEIRRAAVVQAVQTIYNRIDAFGVAEPNVADQGTSSERIVVQVPGVDDPERLKRLIRNTALLELRLVATGTGNTDTRQQMVDGLPAGWEANTEIFEEDIREKGTKNVIGSRFWALERERVISGRDLRAATSTRGQYGEPAVGFSLTREGSVRFGNVTGANIGRGLAIVLDGKVMSVANIQDRITDQGVIHGTFTEQEVNDLVMVLKSGALPASMTIIEERTVGPSLGADSIQKGWQAGLIGSVLVALAMLIVYNFAGVNALIALALNIVMIFAGLSLFGATLTLPGIAGIVLTLGMSVDANVLVFERIREELADGRTVKSAIVTGFDKAWSAILDGNLTALIAAALLIAFGTGPIQGFAWTLSIGIAASMFTAVFLSHWLFDLFYGRRQKVDSISI